MRVFVDSGAFIALENTDDINHQRARAYQVAIAKERIQLVTTNFILDETLTWLRMSLSHSIAVGFREKVTASRIISVERITSNLEEQAWEIFRRYEDKEFSFTDCTSFALTRHLGSDTAFAFDRDFEQFGFGRVPAEK